MSLKETPFDLTCLITLDPRCIGGYANRLHLQPYKYNNISNNGDGQGYVYSDLTPL